MTIWLTAKLHHINTVAQLVFSVHAKRPTVHVELIVPVHNEKSVFTAGEYRYYFLSQLRCLPKMLDTCAHSVCLYSLLVVFEALTASVTTYKCVNAAEETKVPTMTGSPQFSNCRHFSTCWKHNSTNEMVLDGGLRRHTAEQYAFAWKVHFWAVLDLTWSHHDLDLWPHNLTSSSLSWTAPNL